MVQYNIAPGVFVSVGRLVLALEAVARERRLVVGTHARLDMRTSVLVVRVACAAPPVPEPVDDAVPAPVTDACPRPLSARLVDGKRALQSVVRHLARSVSKRARTLLDTVNAAKPAEAPPPALAVADDKGWVALDLAPTVVAVAARLTSTLLYINGMDDTPDTAAVAVTNGEGSVVFTATATGLGDVCVERVAAAIRTYANEQPTFAFSPLLTSDPAGAASIVVRVTRRP